MEISGGAGSAGLNSLVESMVLSGVRAPGGAPMPVAADGTPQDSIATLLELMSGPEIGNLLNSIDAQIVTRDALALDTLLRTADAAVTGHDVARALKALTAYIRGNPEGAAALLSSSSLMPIQSEVGELLRRMTGDAKNDAEQKLARASLAVDLAGKQGEKLNGASVLTIAERLVESGQLVNYYRASELSRAVIAYYFGVIPETVPGLARSAAVRPDRDRASLRTAALVLLWGWFALGLLGGPTILFARMVGLIELGPGTVQAAFEWWVLGLLVLASLRFFIRKS